jgi:epsilon-lactone hydrolase
MASGLMTEDSVTAPALPERPSLRARIVTWLVKLVIKRWPRGDYEKLVHRSRLVFGLPTGMSWLVSRGITYEEIAGADICGEWVIPEANYYEEKVLLYLHGGGYISCNPRTHRPITASLARLAYQRVFALDYRLAPEAPFPAAVDDAAHAFTWLMELGLKPHNIAIAGDSAGGGLVMATLLRLKARQQPMPACAICLSPWVDLTGAASYGNTESCAMFRPEDVSAFAELYLNGKSPRLPEASPVFGDLHGLPPLLIQASTTELLFDEAMQLQKKAQKSGVDCTLSAYPGLPHVWQMCGGLIPEAGTALKEIAAFVHDKTRAIKHTKN